MKKRILAVFLAVIMIAGLCACGKEKNKKMPVSSQAPETDELRDTTVTEEVEESSSVPEKATFVPKTARICAGSTSVAVLMDDKTVSCSLDTSDNEYLDPHDEWKSWTDIVDISMNEEILAAVKSDGTVVWCGGRVKEYDYLNEPETMGVTDEWKNVVQVCAGFDTIAALSGDGTVELAGGIRTEDLDEKDGFTQVAVYDAFFALREDGTVYCFSPWTYEGQDWEYDTGDWKDIKEISAGFDHAVGLKSDGTVVATGSNEYGQCDVENWNDIVQVVAGRCHTIGLKSDGTVTWCGESIENKEELNLAGWTGIEEISGFFDTVAGLKSDGSIVYIGSPDRINPVPVSSVKTK